MYCIATQLADRGPQPDLRSVKFELLHVLEFALGEREKTFWDGSSFYQIWGLKPFQIAVKASFIYFLFFWNGLHLLYLNRC